MDKTSYRILTLTIGCIVLLSVTAEQASAWPCPPCPPCYYRCTETGCEYECGTGQGCCGGICYDPDTKHCCGWAYDGHLCDSDEACCGGTCCDPAIESCCDDGSCKPKCEIVDGEDCDKTSDPPCDETNCAIDVGHPCYSGPARRVYAGGCEKICNPRGCPGDWGDCTDDVKVCYTDYSCVGSSFYAIFSLCTNWSFTGIGAPINKFHYSCEFDVLWVLNKCYSCEQGEASEDDKHYVDNDSCG